MNDRMILVVDDETELLEMVRSIFMRAGFTQVLTASSGEAALKVCKEKQPDMVILDVMMPGMDGYEVARKVSSRHLGVPILMLTAKSGIEDRITDLNAGADYYLTKPFDTRELLACINALLRRQGSQVDELVFGNTSLDLQSASLNCGSNSIRLSAKEFDIMRFLFNSGKNNLSKEAILAKVWGYDSNAVENHVEVYIGFLRKKLASIGSDIHIEAVRKLGYHLEVH